MSESVQRGGVAAGSGFLVFSVATEFLAGHVTDITAACSIVGLAVTVFTSIPKILESCRVLAALARDARRKGSKPQ